MSLSLFCIPDGPVKGQSERPAHPYMHLRRRSGRSPALPYPPRRRPAKLYHALPLCGNYPSLSHNPFEYFFI